MDWPAGLDDARVAFNAYTIVDSLVKQTTGAAWREHEHACGIRRLPRCALGKDGRLECEHGRGRFSPQCPVFTCKGIDVYVNRTCSIPLGIISCPLLAQRGATGRAIGFGVT